MLLKQDHENQSWPIPHDPTSTDLTKLRNPTQDFPARTSDHRPRNGRDDALLDNDARLCPLLERLLGDEVLADGEAEGALVLLLGLVGVRELGGEVLVVLMSFVSFWSFETGMRLDGDGAGKDVDCYGVRMCDGLREGRGYTPS